MANMNDNELLNVSGGTPGQPLDHIIVLGNKCVKCNVCADYCTYKAIKIINGVYTIDRQLCTRCGTCIGVCPVNAIRKETIT